MPLKLYKPKRRLVQTITTVVFILLPFLDLIRMDIPSRKFFFLRRAFWLDEFYFIFLVVMLFIWIFFTFTMIYGRIWCGWMCPQTTLNELTAWLKRRLDRLLSKKQNRPISGWLTKSLFFLPVTVLSLFIAFNLVAYFADPKSMLVDIAAGQLSAVIIVIISILTLFFIFDMVFWREKFCIEACPYGMLQMVMTDEKSQIVSYHTERDHECIRCDACVRCCIMGIDIRESPYQTECIHCGDCIDACALVLGRQKKPLPSLFSFTWGAGDQISKRNFFTKSGLFDIKRWILSGFVFIFLSTLILVSTQRQPISVSISGDRLTLYRAGEKGGTINDYTLRITNRSHDPERIEIKPPDEVVLLVTPGIIPVPLQVGETKILKFSLVTTGENLHPGPNRLILTFFLKDRDSRPVEEEIVFFMPEEGME